MADIKLAGPESLDQIYQIERECFEKFWSKDSILASLRDENTKIYIIEESVPCAYIIYSKIIDEISLDRIAVSKIYRKKGYAGKLIEKMLEENLDTSLEVSEKNFKAISLYQKYKFKVEGIRKDYYKTGEDALIMWRKIR